MVVERFHIFPYPSILSTFIFSLRRHIRNKSVFINESAVGELQPGLLFTMSEIGELRPDSILAVGELRAEFI